MKLSKETLTLIKNYSAISPNLVLKPGKKLSTIHLQNKILANANIVEDFPLQFPIYDLGDFLSVLSIFNDPDLDFSEKYLTIKEGNAELKYFASSLNNMKCPPEKEFGFEDIIVEFELTGALFNIIPKTAGVLKVNDFSIAGDGSSINIVIADKKNATSNSYSTKIGTTTSTFKINIAIDNFKMLPGDYLVSINKKAMRLQSKTSDLVYFVALEFDSVFE